MLDGHCATGPHRERHDERGSQCQTGRRQCDRLSAARRGTALVEESAWTLEFRHHPVAGVDAETTVGVCDGTQNGHRKEG